MPKFRNRLAVFLCTLTLGLFGQSSKRPSTSWAILQGPTGPATTIFTVLHGREEILTGCVGLPNDSCLLKPDSVTKKPGFPTQSVVTHFKFSNLPKRAELKFKVENQRGQTDTRRFGLLEKKDSLKFAVASCMDDSMEDLQTVMWKELLEKSPDVILLIGDNVYADKHIEPKGAATPENLWKRYTETRERLALFRSERLVPIYAVWDDHDYGINDGDSTYPYKVEARLTFQSFFPIQTTHGVSSHFILGGQDLIFLDDRTFRTKDSQWGKAQEEWLFGLLSASNRPAWLINGGQFFGGYHEFESYEGRQAESFRSFLKKMRSVKKPVNLLSGDRHLSEVMKIDASLTGRDLYEITSSAIHAKVFPGAWDKKKNPRQVRGISGEYNYTVIESTIVPSGLKVKLSAYGQGKPLYDYEFLSHH